MEICDTQRAFRQRRNHANFPYILSTLPFNRDKQHSNLLFFFRTLSGMQKL